MGKYYLLLLLLLCGIRSYSQNYKFQALYVFNIAQNVEWPGLTNQFTIGVAGSNEMTHELLFMRIKS